MRVLGDLIEKQARSGTDGIGVSDRRSIDLAAVRATDELREGADFNQSG